MSLMQFVTEECANHRSDGSCLGMPVLLTKDSKMFPAEKCRVAEKKRCTYFEKCVLPIAAQRGSGDVIDAYKSLAGQTAAIKFKARFCACGNPLASRDRYCESCKTKKRRETFRLATTRRRTSPVNS
jgi:hypothetical protein